MENIELEIEALASRLANLKEEQKFWQDRCHNRCQQAMAERTQIRACLLDLFKRKRRSIRI